MMRNTQRGKRGPERLDLIDVQVAITPELDRMLDQLVTSSGIAKSSIVRSALARFGEELGYLAPGTTDATPITLTRGPGLASRKESA